MKMPKSVIAGLGVLVLGASALVQAAPNDQGGPDRGGQHEQQRGDDVAAVRPRTSARYAR
jgi:hypothetical protein